jgi:hypothetical protein
VALDIFLLEQELGDKCDITGENDISSDFFQYWTPLVGAFASGTQKEDPKRDPKKDQKEDPKKGSKRRSEKRTQY